MTRPRLCTGCGVNPVAYYGREFCYRCVPRVWKRPPRCKRCGSQTGYYTAGLCRRCHRSAPMTNSCLDCLAWGVTRRNGGLCQGCRGWRRRFPVPQQCPSCRRMVTVNTRGFCRLCCRQASLVRPRHQAIDITAANRHGQQLFLADLFRQKRPTLILQARRYARSGCYPVAHRQLVLFDARRDLAAGRRRGFPFPPLPGLAAALDGTVCSFAAQRGWSPQLQAATRLGIRVLLATQDTPGAPVKASDVEALAQLAFNNVRAVTEVLAIAGMLDDDREPALDIWFARRAAGLPAPMAREFRLWFEVLRDGSNTPPRCRPRRPATIRVHISRAAPILHAWAAAGHQSLRETTSQDITGTLPAQASQRHQALVAMRSLFRHLKGRRVIFANPAARLRGAPHALGQPLPVNLDIVRAAIHSGQPARAALAAMVAFHALRAGQLTILKLTDVRDGRLHLDGRAIPLAEPVREKLAAWLDERARRWPATSNPHLFINFYTAVRDCPVSRVWISATIGASAQAIREDRILHEAQVTGGDIRRLCDLFGLTVGGAERYARPTGADP